MRRGLLIAALVVPLAIGAPARSQAPAPEPTCDGAPPAAHIAAATQIAERAYAFKRWQHRRPLGDRSRAEIQAHSDCVGPGAQQQIGTAVRERHDDFTRNRLYRKVAPFPGFSGEGYWLHHLAVPRYIAACETAGYVGDARFKAHNQSGSDATGYAQALGSTWRSALPSPSRQRDLSRSIGQHIQFGPTAASSSPLAQHIVFDRIWRRDGRQAWACG